MRARGLVVLAALLAGCGSASRSTATHRQRPVTSMARQPSVAATTPAPASPSPALASLQRALARQLGAAGTQTGALVYDLTTHQQLFAQRAGIGRPPASVEKLYTSFAVLNTLGPDQRFQTSVLGAGQLGHGGVWHGDLYLRGGGDPTLGDGAFNRVWEEGYGPTAEQLAAQLRAGGIRSVTGLVIGDASLFDSRRGVPSSGYAPDVGDLGGQLAALTYDHGATLGRLSPGAFAARELTLTMRGAGIRAWAAKRTKRTPPDAQPLASVSSPPTSVLLKLTDVPSDDFFAELLTKQLGVRFGAGGTTTAGAAVIASSVATLGIHPRIVDGSGLSRDDSSSPRQIVDLLRAVSGTPSGRVLDASLPVVGVSGTVQRIGLHSGARGRCVAKTGTLNYVSNLAGYCNSRGGDTLAFALLLDGPTNVAAYKLMGPMLGAMVRY
jgi:D-alanyl-D-alanine carboxypeptidase/D-alanyl-D-alanine-endopeptidase (penicillin-binding protein 4)